MKRIILNLFFFLSFSILQAQTNLYLESTVIEDDTEVPVLGAKIIIEDVNLTTHTNEKGFFSFEKELPEGDYVVSVSKEGYESKIFLIKQRKGLKIKLKEIRISVIKKEAKRRKKLKKKQEKEAKERLKKIKKERRKKEKLLEKQKEKLLEENTVEIVYDSISSIKKVEEPEPISKIQLKYSKILEVDPVKLTNIDLYEFIDRWIGTPYLWGGETRKAIDCSSFTQRLFAKSYDMYLERTAQKQCSSELTDLFEGLNHLNEGDLLFFGKDQFNIVHVGVYLHNNKFVHATARKVDGDAGVKISDLKNPYWSNLLMSAGRRKKAD